MADLNMFPTNDAGFTKTSGEVLGQIAQMEYSKKLLNEKIKESNAKVQAEEAAKAKSYIQENAMKYADFVSKAAELNLPWEYVNEMHKTLQPQGVITPNQFIDEENYQKIVQSKAGIVDRSKVPDLGVALAGQSRQPLGITDPDKATNEVQLRQIQKKLGVKIDGKNGPETKQAYQNYVSNQQTPPQGENGTGQVQMTPIYDENGVKKGEIGQTSTPESIVQPKGNVYGQTYYRNGAGADSSAWNKARMQVEERQNEVLGRKTKSNTGADVYERRLTLLTKEYDDFLQGIPANIKAALGKYSNEKDFRAVYGQTADQYLPQGKSWENIMDIKNEIEKLKPMVLSKLPKETNKNPDRFTGLK